ncbi:HAD-IIIC family phosphatase [Pseudobutyrivibrio ruminis]|uniref:HAD-superfamily phosphatase, subfamily IIIC/FkbH-like domain-containing protein n=1 Tax=Pseudobutyrivibrio ruminis DSM 9787 TaxID=1123011 RepID=A0A285S7Z1_9FIRM|nr:HAD-IIIC family phosphatase [Pseudobutyrivibrio ruminis]SOC03693.1 HAD-superfamily phosphatase, subfamily IIIC/FkbH-like domain-containing protein [Pseudobutyrivibrio ruminis DSM 9787]
MKELEYPFDSDYLLSKKKRIKKELLATDTKFIDKKIAVLGGGTTANIILMLELFLLNNGIRPEFYESEYNKYYEDAVFPNPELEEFAPDIIYVCTSNRNITSYPNLAMDMAAVDELLDAQYAKFETIWKTLAEKYNCPIIQNNFEMPLFRLLGNRDAYDYRGSMNFITRLNQRMYDYAMSTENFYICDINYISADYGLKEWSDPFYWYMYKYAMCVPAIPSLSFNVANIIKSLLGKNKKGFVLDLDNTLWGGVIGDDGVDGIVLGPEEAEGQAYTEFQRYLKAHQQLGIILNVDSKNDMENAIAGINHPDSEFQEKDFISIKANWDPKDKNFEDIASELTLLPESLVFVDDNPAERHIVTEQLKGVCAPELDNVVHYIQTIDRSGFFEATNISADDLKRNEMYQENAARAKLQSSFTDYGQYLDSLEMQAEIDSFAPVYMARIAQLTNKSNQFNLTTKRFTQTEIEETAADSNYVTLYGKLIDKFGDNGVVTVAIGHVDGDACDIDLWLMSCRVLKRDMEFAMMDELVARLKARGVKELRGHYLPTAKNKMVKNFYGDMGFTLVEEKEDGSSDWTLDLSGYENQNKHIKMN